MVARNRILALAGAWKFGDRFARILEMLPPERRAGVPKVAGRPEERLAALRERERRRIAKLGRKRFGAGWTRLDPRIREAWLRTQR